MIFLASNISNFLNLLLSLLLARTLTPAGFGQISAFFAIQLFGLLLISGWQNTLLIHLKSFNREQREGFSRWAMSHVRLLAGALLLATYAQFAIDETIASIRIILTAACVLLALGLNFWLIHLRAVDLFDEKIGHFSINLILENGSRLIIIFSSTYITKDPFALVSIGAASQIIPFLSYLNVRNYKIQNLPLPSFNLGQKFILLQGGFFAFFDSDLVLTASLYNSNEAGKIAVLNLAAKIVFFAFSGITISLIADQARLTPEEARVSLMKSLKFLILSTILIITVGAMLPDIAFMILAGDPDYATTPELTIILSTATIFAMNAMLMNAQCAQTQFKWVTPYIGIAFCRWVSCATLLYLNFSLTSLLVFNLASQILLLIINIGFVYSRKWKPRHV